MESQSHRLRLLIHADTVCPATLVVSKQRECRPSIVRLVIRTSLNISLQLAPDHVCLFVASLCCHSRDSLRCFSLNVKGKARLYYDDNIGLFPASLSILTSSPTTNRLDAILYYSNVSSALIYIPLLLLQRAGHPYQAFSHPSIPQHATPSQELLHQRAENSPLPKLQRRAVVPKAQIWLCQGRDRRRHHPYAISGSLRSRRRPA